jgi:16S rRNA G527 N7-methylase RsmG
MDPLLRAWMSEVRLFNNRLHLVSPSLEKSMEDQVQDTMELLALIHEPVIGDLGAGSGFLGIPYKVLNPGARVSLIERSGKKCIFLRHVIDRLGLNGVDVMEADPLKKDVGPIPALMSRAFSPKESLIRTVLRAAELPGRFYYIQTGEPEDMDHTQFTLEDRASRQFGGYRLNLDTYLVTSR